MKNWSKLGLVYKSPLNGSWNDNSALTPTPIRLNGDVIRVYASFRDKFGVGRIGYVDLSSSNPTEVLGVSHSPVLDIGQPGSFDDNGMILGDVIWVGGKLYMYYVGFQLVKKVKFLAYTGLAISEDGGETFVRRGATPVMDRSDEGLFIRAIHTVRFEEGKFKAWYATGNGWQAINGKLFPQYEISYTESKDGLAFSDGQVVIENTKSNLEYRIGRPRVYKKGSQYEIYFTYGTTDGSYFVGYADSKDGVTWNRDDSILGLSLSSKGWDSRHLCYPALFQTDDGIEYMIYNGNDMGLDGFGIAKLEQTA